ncbi:MAG: baeRF3 domain-containing protein, partial [Gemmatimonadales bacterium]
MRRLSTPGRLATLPTDYEPPCISLYQPTHRHHPANQQDSIRYRNLLRTMETSLRERYPDRDARALLARFESLAHDTHFWNHRTDGLAIMAWLPDHFEIFDLQRPVRELVVVANSFHTKPMLRILQSADRYQILSLNRHEAKLYEGNRDSLDPIPLDHVPHTITEALGDKLTEPHTGVRSFGGGSGQGAVHHGIGQRKDEVDLDAQRFFRAIDRAILEHHSKPSGLPLILAALPEHHTLFRALSHNTALMPQGIAINPDALDLQQLRAAAWEVMSPRYLERLARLIDVYQGAKNRNLASDAVDDIASATL